MDIEAQSTSQSLERWKFCELRPTTISDEVPINFRAVAEIFLVCKFADDYCIVLNIRDGTKPVLVKEKKIQDAAT